MHLGVRETPGRYDKLEYDNDNDNDNDATTTRQAFPNDATSIP
ncbi:hypothetical protein [uncultured Thiodictyon sp.]|jgi:hypothetical protein|nr:hypothetical protein [uncultured Thiodictyon sp.]